MSQTRLFFAAMPPPDVVAAISEAVQTHALDQQLGRKLFAPSNWHQSLSERVFDAKQADIALLRAAGERVRAHACTLQYNRIRSSVSKEGRVHVTLLAKGAPKAFVALNEAVRDTLRAADYADIATGVTPHTTLSYDAPSKIDNIDLEKPLLWTINELLLVMGQGQPYRYDVIDRWPLLPERNPIVTQTSLF